MNNVHMQALVKTFPQLMSILSTAGLMADKRIGTIYEHRFGVRNQVRIVESGLSIEVILSVMKEGTNELENCEWDDIYAITIGREVYDDPAVTIYLSRENIETVEFSFVEVDGLEKCLLVSSASEEADFELVYDLDFPEEAHFQNSLLHVLPDYSFMETLKSTYSLLRKDTSHGYAYISAYVYSSYGRVQDDDVALAFEKWITDYTSHYEVSRNLALMEKDFAIKAEIEALKLLETE